MMELFRAEADGQTAALASGLLALEGGDASPATLESLMRAAHSLKGAARIVGVDAAVRVAHVMEDCFVAAQKGKLDILPAHVDVLLRAVDLLTRIAQIADDQIEAWQAENEPTVAAMVADLAAILEGGPPAAAPPEAVQEPEPIPPAPEPAPPAPAAPAPEPADRVVRVTADSLTRLVGLAGESL